MDARDFARIDSALAAVIVEPGNFTEFQVDFAMTNAERLDLYGEATNFSEKQLGVVREIEARIAETHG